MMEIDVERLKSLVAAIFAAKGCSPEEAARIALYLVNANLTGHDSHGVIRVPRYVGWLEAGEVVADQKPVTEVDSGALTVIDAGYGFGQTMGPIATQAGIDKAKREGVAIVALKHSGHLGRIGEWAEMAAAEGLASLHLVNVAGSQLVAPFGGTGRRISTAPFAAGMPVAGRDPVILDFATSAVAEGKVLVAAKGGKPIPGDALVGPDGSLSGDPAVLYGEAGPDGVLNNQNGPGAIRTFGEHKGSGLALMCELFAGALIGSGCAGPGERRFCNGMLSIVMTPRFFGSEEGIAREAKSYLDFFTSSPPATAGGAVLLPGDPERATRAERTKNGVPLSDEAWASIVAVAEQAGISAGR